MSIPEETKLHRMALYNYGVALFHISMPWALNYATKAFVKLLDELEGHEDEFKLNLITHSALAMTYAKMAEFDIKNREKLIEDAFKEADKVLSDERASNIAKSNAIAAKGFSLLYSRNLDQAITFFHESIELNPENVIVMIAIGNTYLQANQKEEALSVFHQAASISPMNGYVCYRLGIIYYRTYGDLEEAINVLQRAPGFAYARLLLGKIYLEEERFTEALEEFRSAAKLNTHLSEAWVNIAWTIHKLHNKKLFKEAEISARRALQLDSIRNRAQLWHRHAILSLCLLENGKFEKALNEAQNAVKYCEERKIQKPEYYDENKLVNKSCICQSYLYLGRALFELKSYSRCQEVLQIVIENDKSGEFKVEALQLLEMLKIEISEKPL